MKELITIFIFFPLFITAQQTINKSITHDGLERDYIIHVPASYNSNTPIPLVFCFHGYGGDASSIMSYTNFNYISDTANFIVVFPQGTLFQGTTHWNVGGWTLGSSTNDIDFIDNLLDSISYGYNIDASRVYSTGMSNGGYMSFLLACQMSDKIAAIASVTGSMTPQTYNSCNPQHPTPVLQIHGTNDQVVPYLGDPSWTISINSVLEYWIDYNNCNTFSETTAITDINTSDGSNVERKRWEDGNNSVVTEHLKVYNGGHDWIGVWGNMDTHASAEVWKFFSKYNMNGLIEASTSIEDKTITNKILIRITDMLGRDTKQVNQPLLYIYDDGTVEKNIIIK